MLEDPEPMDLGLVENHDSLVYSHDGNGVAEHTDASVEGEVPPADSSSRDENSNSLRRSQRASARRAQERMRGEFKDMLESDMNNSFHMLDEDDDHDLEAMDDVVAVYTDNEPKKIRRRALDEVLDPTDAHFAIQEEADGTVVVLSDDSEVSAFTPEELELIRRQYVKTVSHELTDDQRKQRALMINELRTQLRMEEVKLVMLKKIRLSQQLPSYSQLSTQSMSASRAHHYDFNQDMQQHGGPYATGRPTAYCPPVATPNQIKGSQINSKMFQEAYSRGKVSAQANNGYGVKLNSTSSNGKAGHMGVSGSQSTKPTVHDLQSPAQQYATAKLALRKQLEKTLLQIPPPKPPPPEMDFIPNPHQGDFICLVGLDEIVQRLLHPKEKGAAGKQQASAKDAGRQHPQQNGVTECNLDSSAEQQQTTKQQADSDSVYVDDKAGSDSNACLSSSSLNMPFICAQCGTDFTPYWKMQMGKVVCEHCIRSNERAVLKSEHTSRLKQAFVKALQQEQEIDRQIQEGSFNFSSLAASMDTTPATSSVSSALNSSGPAGSKSAKGGSSTNTTCSTLNNDTLNDSVATAIRNATMAVAAAGNMAYNPLAAAAGLPIGFSPQLMGVGWNPLLAGRFPAAAAANMSTAWIQNLPRELVKHLQMQQRNAAVALQRQLFLDMLPQQRPQKWK